MTKLDEHDRIVADVLDECTRELIKSTGDGVLACFSRPSDAVRAATALVERLADVALPIRAGVHLGEVVRRNADLIGVAVTFAARLCEQAGAGEVLTSVALRDALLGTDAPLVHRGEVELKGIDGVWQLYGIGAPAGGLRRRSIGASRSPLPLPKPRSTFLGRTDELDVVLALVADHRLVTITGTGGAGKTRLSLEVARSFTGGPAAFVDLASLSEGAQIPLAIATAFGLDVESGDDAWPQVCSGLAREQGLVVVDNCEHVLDEIASYVDELLDATAHPRVLATSRASLDLSDEHRYPLPPLSEQVGNELFHERARLADPDQVLDAEGVAVIVAGLDGLPLAIERVAARTRSLTPEQILRMHDDMLLSLTGARRDFAPRQRTLEAAIRWSYDLLTDNEQTLLRRLSVFPGWFPLDDVAPVCAFDPAAAIDGVESLVAKSLLGVVPLDGLSGYRMLDTIRAFGRHELADRGEAAAAERRHAERLVAWIEERTPHDRLVDLDWGELQPGCSVAYRRFVRSWAKEYYPWRTCLRSAASRLPVAEGGLDGVGPIPTLANHTSMRSMSGSRCRRSPASEVTMT